MSCLPHTLHLLPASPGALRAHPHHTPSACWCPNVPLTSHLWGSCPHPQAWPLGLATQLLQEVSKGSLLPSHDTKATRPLTPFLAATQPWSMACPELLPCHQQSLQSLLALPGRGAEQPCPSLPSEGAGSQHSTQKRGLEHLWGL